MLLFMFKQNMGVQKRLLSKLNNKNLYSRMKMYSFYRKDVWGILKLKRTVKFKKAVYSIMRHEQSMYQVMLYKVFKGVKFTVKDYRPVHYRLFAKKLLRLFYYKLREKFFGKLGAFIKKKNHSKIPFVDAFFSGLERRLDVVLLRSMYLNKILVSRQFIREYNVFVNKYPVNLPGFLVSVGEIVMIKAKPFKMSFFNIWRNFLMVKDFWYYRRKLIKFFFRYVAFKKIFFKFFLNIFKYGIKLKKKFKKLIRLLKKKRRKFFFLFCLNLQVKLLFYFFVFKFFKFLYRIALVAKFFEFCFSRDLYAIYRKKFFMKKIFLKKRRRKLQRFFKLLKIRVKLFKKSSAYLNDFFFSKKKIIFVGNNDRHVFKKHYFWNISQKLYFFLKKKYNNKIFWMGLPSYMEVNFKIHKLLLVSEPKRSTVYFSMGVHHKYFFEYFRIKSFF